MFKGRVKNEIKKQYLYIDCIEARSLKSCDANGWSDPFCIITLGEKTKIGKTRYIERTLNPRWIQRFQYSGPIDMNHNAYLTFTVKDYDALSKSDLIGLIEIPLCDFAEHMWTQKWYRLQPENEEDITRGWILLRIHLCKNPKDAFKEEFHDKSADNTHNAQHIHIHGDEYNVNQTTLHNVEKHEEKLEQKEKELEEEKERNEEKKQGLFCKHRHKRRNKDADQNPDENKMKDTNDKEHEYSDDKSCSSDCIEKP